jgi:hypothetical protein
VPARSRPRRRDLHLHERTDLGRLFGLEVFAESHRSSGVTGFEQLISSIGALRLHGSGDLGVEGGLGWRVHDAVRLHATLSCDIRAATLSNGSTAKAS